MWQVFGTMQNWSQVKKLPLLCLSGHKTQFSCQFSWTFSACLSKGVVSVTNISCVRQKITGYLNFQQNFNQYSECHVSKAIASRYQWAEGKIRILQWIKWVRWEGPATILWSNRLTTFRADQGLKHIVKCFVVQKLLTYWQTLWIDQLSR